MSWWPWCNQFWQVILIPEMKQFLTIYFKNKKTLLISRVNLDTLERKCQECIFQREGKTCWGGPLCVCKGRKAHQWSELLVGSGSGMGINLSKWGNWIAQRPSLFFNFLFLISNLIFIQFMVQHGSIWSIYTFDT